VSTAPLPKLAAPSPISFTPDLIDPNNPPSSSSESSFLKTTSSRIFRSSAPSNNSPSPEI